MPRNVVSSDADEQLERFPLSTLSHNECKSFLKSLHPKNRSTNLILYSDGSLEVDHQNNLLDSDSMVVLNVNDDMEIMKNEIFGPVMPIKPYKDFNETVEYINKKQKPLAMYYFGSDENEINTLLDKTSSGSLVVNDTIFQTAQYNLPFGGVGSSGSGSYRGKDGFKNFSHKRSFFKGSNLLDATKLIFPPYDEKTEKNITRMIR